MTEVVDTTPAAAQQTYRISQAGDATGVSVDTLRYYERAGIMPDIKRDDGGRRVYTTDDLGWITFVRRLRGTGMSMQAVAEYTRMVRTGEGTIADRRHCLEQHREVVAAALAELTDAMMVLDRKIQHYAAAESGREVDSSVQQLQHVGELG